MLIEKLGITDDVEFERCHRMSQKSNQNHPRAIICKATKFKDKTKILKIGKYLKGTGIYIYENLCKETVKLRKKLWNQVFEYRKQNRFAYLNYRSVVVREHGRDRAVR